MKPENNILQKLKKVKDIFVKTSKSGGKVIILAMEAVQLLQSRSSRSHKNARIRSVNFNKSDLITCFQMIMDMIDGLKNL